MNLAKRHKPVTFIEASGAVFARQRSLLGVKETLHSNKFQNVKHQFSERD